MRALPIARAARLTIGFYAIFNLTRVTNDNYGWRPGSGEDKSPDAAAQAPAPIRSGHTPFGERLAKPASACPSRSAWTPTSTVPRPSGRFAGLEGARRRAAAAVQVRRPRHRRGGRAVAALGRRSPSSSSQGAGLRSAGPHRPGAVGRAAHHRGRQAPSPAPRRPTPPSSPGPPSIGRADRQPSSASHRADSSSPAWPTAAASSGADHEPWQRGPPAPRRAVPAATVATAAGRPTVGAHELSSVARWSAPARRPTPGACARSTPTGGSSCPWARRAARPAMRDAPRWPRRAAGASRSVLFPKVDNDA